MLHASIHTSVHSFNRSPLRNAEPVAPLTEADKKKQRLAAWKKAQAEKKAGASGDVPTVSNGQGLSTTHAMDAPDDLPPSGAHIPKSVYERRTKFLEEEAQRNADQAAKQKLGFSDNVFLAQGEVDPLDAFMQDTVLPEVAAKQAEEAAAKEAERLKRAQELQKAKEQGKPIKSLAELEAMEEEQEPEADQEIEIPTNKVKLVIGPNGDKIKWIERKSKCHIQVVSYNVHSGNCVLNCSSALLVLGVRAVFLVVLVQNRVECAVAFLAAAYACTLHACFWWILVDSSITSCGCRSKRQRKC